jgi:hypothetical protein
MSKRVDLSNRYSQPATWIFIVGPIKEVEDLDSFIFDLHTALGGTSELEQVRHGIQEGLSSKLITENDYAGSHIYRINLGDVTSIWQFGCDIANNYGISKSKHILDLLEGIEQCN